MKVLQVHNSYQQHGGEDVVVQQEYELLQNHGHEVRQLLKSNHDIRTPRSKLNLLFTTHYNRSSREEVLCVLKDFMPDVVHVHNFFPLFSPSIFDAFLDHQVPSVFTLHNYRLIHPNGLLLHDGKIDERGLVGSAYDCIKDRVYRHSYLQTAVVAHMIDYHRRKGTWDDKVTRFIALSDFAKIKFLEWGLPESKLLVKPNFIEEALARSPIAFSDREGFIYIGRISSEKGIAPLIEYWKCHQSQPLHIVGEGPLKDELINQTEGFDQIIWHGKLSRATTLDQLRKSKALVFPSICYENFPMTILEAFANGIPVLANKFGSHGSIVEHQYNGLHFDINNAMTLSEAVKKVLNAEVNENLSTSAYRTYKEQFGSTRNHDMLLSIYQEAIEAKVNGVR